MLAWFTNTRPISVRLSLRISTSHKTMGTGNHLWNVGSGIQRNNHVHFYNGYLLLLKEEDTGEQASRVCSNQWGIVGPFSTLRQGTPDECRWSCGHSGHGCASNSGPYLAAGWVRPSHRAVSAGGGFPNESRQPRSESAGNVAAWTQYELSRGKSSSDWLISGIWSTSLSAVACGAWPNGYWRCCGSRWLASSCFALPVD
jgi:hypothetical protein